MNSISILKIVIGTIFIAGSVMMLIGAIRMLISAFRTSILWGLGWLFVPFCQLIYLIVHWEDAKSGFFLYLKGFFVFALGLICAIAIPNWERARVAHAREPIASSQPDKDPWPTNSIEKGHPVASPFQKSATAATNQTFRLQGIFYNSTKPSAVINGNTVFVGDKVAEWSVTAISNQTVTLQNGSGEINTLSLK